MIFNMKVFFLSGLLLLFSVAGADAFAGKEPVVKKKDRRKDVLMVTSLGNIVIRLSDATPGHRDNFLLLVKKQYYDSVLFHRVISQFMIQAGDPNSRRARAGMPLGNGGPGYTLPAEFRENLFHKKGALAAARMGDQVNPEKASSGSQFYIVQGRRFTDAGLDSVEQNRLKGMQLPAGHREIYKSLGGTPHLDQQYTVFGEVVKGIEVIDQIAQVPTSKGQDRDRPLTDIRILSTRLIRRSTF